MSIKVKLNGSLRQFTRNKGIVSVKGSTIGECLNDLMMQFSEIREWLFDTNGILKVFIKLNGEAVHDNLCEPVRDGSEIELIMMVGGG